MIFYTSLLTILFTMHLIRHRIEFNETQVKWALLIFLVYFATYREVQLTTDAIAYYNLSSACNDWSRIFENPCSKDMELINRALPVVVNKIFQWSESVYLIMFFLYAMIAVYLKLNYIEKYSPYFYLSLAYYIVYTYSYQEMVVTRNGVVVALFFWAIPDIINRKPFRYYAKIFLATTFHSAAFLYLPVYFLSTKKLSNKYKVIAIICLILTSIGKSITSIIVPYLSGVEKLKFYLVNTKTVGHVMSYHSPMEWMPLFLAILTFKEIKESEIKDEMFILVSKIFYIGLIIRYNLSAISATAALRFGDNFLAINCIFFAYSYKYLDERGKMLVLLFNIYIIYSRINIGYIPLN